MKHRRFPFFESAAEVSGAPRGAGRDDRRNLIRVGILQPPAPELCAISLGPAQPGHEPLADQRPHGSPRKTLLRRDPAGVAALFLRGLHRRRRLKDMINSGLLEAAECRASAVLPSA